MQIQSKTKKAKPPSPFTRGAKHCQDYRGALPVQVFSLSLLGLGWSWKGECACTAPMPVLVHGGLVFPSCQFSFNKLKKERYFGPCYAPNEKQDSAQKIHFTEQASFFFLSFHLQFCLSHSSRMNVLFISRHFHPVGRHSLK